MITARDSFHRLYMQDTDEIDDFLSKFVDLAADAEIAEAT
jgi:hypothetical protein